MSETKQPIGAATATLLHDWSNDEAYYQTAEAQCETFWSPEQPFRQMFDRLDSSVVVDLACGRGRHSWAMRDWPNRKILVDLVPENIRLCRERFKGVGNVEFFVNNGADLAMIADASVTALFCYDAMVHFDHRIVGNYLAEIERILVPGGKALLHHSNYPGNPGHDYKINPHWRNFMPPGLFVDYAAKAGLSVHEQRLFDWGGSRALDCLSLVAKS